MMMARMIMRRRQLAMMGVVLAGAMAGNALAQSANAPIDSDLVKPQAPTATPAATPAATAPASAGASYTAGSSAAPSSAASSAGASIPNGEAPKGTYHEDDLIGAAESVFGKGAKGVAQAIQKILKKQGEPNGYIKGREAGGAFAVGLRYGSGTLYHKIEGQRAVYWTGPSIGFDAGASAGNTFVLVYNLYNSEDLYKRFAAGEGQAFVVGGFNVSYLRRGDVVLIPVRAGVGLRLGVNAGYMKFSKKQNWFPL